MELSHHLLKQLNDGLQGLNADRKYIDRIRTAFAAIYTVYTKGTFLHLGAHFYFSGEKSTFEMAKIEKWIFPPKSRVFPQK